MASSGNFSTFNPLDNTENNGVGGCDFAIGNCQGGGAGDNVGIASTIATGNTGKYYAEFYLSATPGTAYVGYYPSTESAIMTKVWVPSGNRTWLTSNLASYAQNGYLYKDGSSTSSWGSTFTTGDIIQIAIDADNDAVYYGKNNTWQNSGDPESGSSKTGAARTSIPKNVFPAVGHANGSGTVTWKANFGQDSTFGGTISAGGNADANGFGDFQYSPPSGYVALSTANLPISDDIDPAQTDDDYPGKQFNTVLFTGNGSSNAVTGLGFQPDLIWGFTRDGAQSKRVIDSTRGGSARFYSDLTSAENTTSTISSFDSDGFTAAGSTFNNDSGKACGAWCWRANGGTTTSDSSGDITVTRQTNTAGGFSILTYSGNGSDNQTLAHGLGAEPAFIIIKNRDTANHWAAWTQHLGDNTKWIELNAIGAQQSDTNQFYNSGMSTSNIGVRSGAAVNGSGNNLIAYVWSEVEGYSKFSTYEGNGNVNGPFVYTGFRPRMVWLKNLEQSSNWQVYDTARNVDNVIDNYLAFDNGSVENFASGTFDISIYSNGFKIRSTETNCNSSGRTFIYGAWGDVPFKYNNTF